MVGSLTACIKKVDCNVPGRHVHLYKNEKGYIRYIDKEYLIYEGYSRNEKYKDIEVKEELYKFLDKNNLMRIDDNLDLLISVQRTNKDYIDININILICNLYLILLK